MKGDSNNRVKYVMLTPVDDGRIAQFTVVELWLIFFVLVYIYYNTIITGDCCLIFFIEKKQTGYTVSMQ